MPEHVRNSKVRQHCFHFVNHKWFSAIFIYLTLGNTVTLAFHHHNMSEDLTRFTHLAERFFRYCFIVEMIVKIAGLGFKSYISDKFNLFDAVLVLLSIVEETFTYVEAIKMHGGAFGALRALRLLRVFRLARSWKKLQDLLTKMEGSLKDIWTFFILFCIFEMIWLLLG